MRIDDLIICVAYFSIPIQLVFSLYQYPRLASMPPRVLVLCILFALFIFLCGAGHLMRCLNHSYGTSFLIMNSLTAFISLTTALYLLPLVPSLMSDLDSSLQELVMLNEETKESKRKLFTFMAFLCHEIRNPLFAIATNVEFAHDMEMSAELESALNSIHQSTSLMLRLVNDVLDLSKIESGKLELEEQEFDIRDFFQNVASSMSSQIKHKRHGQVDFVFNIAHNMPRVVRSDSVRLLQIAYNVLSNAAKFTEQGSITFSVSVCDLKPSLKAGLVKGKFPQAEGNSDNSDEDDGECALNHHGEHPEHFSLSLLQAAEEGHCCSNDGFMDHDHHLDAEIKVLKMQFEDTGLGIPPERMERIFLPYTQSKLSDFRKHGGTGLGLSIISKLTEIMGGTIKVESEENVGSKFVVHVPIIVPKDQINHEQTADFATPKELLNFGHLAEEDTNSSSSSSAGSRSEQVKPPVLPMFDTLSQKNPAPLFALDTPLNGPASIPLFDLATVQDTLEAETIPPIKSPEKTPESSPTSAPTTTTSNAENLDNNHNNNNTSEAVAAPQAAPLFSTAAAPQTAPLSSPASAAPQAAPLFSTAPQASPLFSIPVNSNNNGSNTPNTIIPTPTTGPIMKSPQTQAAGTVASPSRLRVPNAKKPPLRKFSFEKNSNLVLVVDDNAVNRKLIGKMLSFFNVEYDQAEHGQMAVDILAKSRNVTGDPDAPHFGLVIMDLCMPIMDGYEAIETLRQQGLNVPIIALTANALAEGRQKAMEAGADEFATKPILRTVLHAKCQQYLDEMHTQASNRSS